MCGIVVDHELMMCFGSLGHHNQDQGWIFLDNKVVLVV